MPLSPLMTPTLHVRLTGNRRKNGSPVAREITMSSKTVVFKHFFAPPKIHGWRATSIWSIKYSDFIAAAGQLRARNAWDYEFRFADLLRGILIRIGKDIEELDPGVWLADPSVECLVLLPSSLADGHYEPAISMRLSDSD